MLFVLPILVVGLPFLLVNGLTRICARQWTPKVIQWPEVFEFDPVLGWRAKAHLDCHILEQRDDIFHVRTDEEGWPRTRALAESKMVVIGDSHAWGYGVDYDKTFFNLISESPVKAIGVPGYNLVQELLLMERLAPQLRDKLVVWFVYIGNDLYDNLSPEMSGYRTPFVRLARGSNEWEIVTSHLRADRWTVSSGSLRRLNSAVYGRSYFAERAYGACEFLIAKASELCRQVGARLVIVSIPTPFALTPTAVEEARQKWKGVREIDPEFPDQELRAICAKLGVPFVALMCSFVREDYKERDDHWTESGHQKVATLLRELCQHETISASGMPREHDAVRANVTTTE
jgi:hypothetical protein